MNLSIRIGESSLNSAQIKRVATLSNPSAAKAATACPRLEPTPPPVKGEGRPRRRLRLLVVGLIVASALALAAPAISAGAPCSANPASFDAGSWPPACWRPYGSASPFNRPLGRDPRVERGSKRIVRGTLNEKRVQRIIVGHPRRSPGDFGHPIYYADRADPLYTIRCVRWVQGCEVHGMKIRIPSKALPAGGSDAHMAVIDAASHWEYDLWEVRTAPLPSLGGTVWVGHGGRTRWGTPDSTGLHSNATAAHFGLSAGVIRAEEWAAAASRNGAIRHALFAGVSCTNGRSVYPAAPGTNGTVCEHGRKAAPPLGARYQLDMTNAQIDALRAPAWKSALLKTLARYGMIVGDTFGGSQHAFGIVSESDTQYTALGYPGRFAALGQAWDAPVYDGGYVFDIAPDVGWRKNLRVVRPCVSRRAC